MNIEQTKQAIKWAFKIGRTPNLIGLHGEGKSTVVKQLVKEMGYNYKEFRTGQAADAGDLTGLPQFKIHEKGYEYTHFVLPEWFPREENTVVFFDEVNRGAKDILNGVFEAILDLSMKGIPMPKNCHIVAACNPPTDDYSGTIDFNDKAFQDRFLHITFKPTFQEFYSYMYGKFPSSGFLAFLQEDQKMLRDGNLMNFDLAFIKPSPRSWESVFALESYADKGEIENNLFFEMVMGLVGNEAANAGMTFKKTHVGSIKALDILNNYGKVRQSVLTANEKGRTDIIGNLLNELGEVFKNAKEMLPESQQDSMVAFISDLQPEQVMMIFTTICLHHHSCKDLANRDDIVEIATKVSKIREEVATKATKAETKKPKKKKEVEEIPF